MYLWTTICKRVTQITVCRSDPKTILGIFFTNDMNFIDDSAALFPVMARVNHACQPNADFVCRPYLGKNSFIKVNLGFEF